MPAEIFSDVTRSSRDWTLVQVSSADLARTPSGIGDTENHLHDLLSTTSNETLLTTCNRRPWCLELTARTFATNYFNRTFQALSKNVFIPADIALSALETFLYKFTHLPTYLLTYLLIKGGAARRPTGLAFMITTFVQLRRSTLHATITTVIWLYYLSFFWPITAKSETIYTELASENKMHDIIVLPASCRTRLIKCVLPERTFRVCMHW